MKKSIWLKFGLSFAVVLVLQVLGLIWSVGNEYRQTVGIIGFLILGLLIGLLLFLNGWGSKRFNKKMELNVAQRQEFFRQRSAEARENLQQSIRRIHRLRQGTVLYLALMAVLTAGLCFFMGTSGKAGMSILGIYLVYGFLCRVDCVPKKKRFAGYTQPEDYPRLHALCRRAAEEIGLRGEIRIGLQSDCNAGIARIGNCYSILLGVALLDILSEEELYSVLLHEFGHESPEANPHDRDVRLLNYLNNGDESNYSRIFTLLFRWFATVYGFEFAMYRAAAGVVVEEIADAAVKRCGKTAEMAATLQKLNYYDLFCEELDDYIREPFYAPESPRTDSRSRMAATFRSVFPAERERWDELAAVEIQSRSASHPIFRKRLEPLGVTEVHSELPDDEGEYRAECRKAMKEADSWVPSQEEYAGIREEQYLKPLRRVEKWEEAGRPEPTDEELPDLVMALNALYRYDEAEKLCRNQIEKLGQCAASAFAVFYCGRMAADRRDKEAIDLLYKAAEINRNYIEPALSTIGGLCCRMGWQEELEEYRCRAVVLGQQHEDESGALGDINGKTAVSTPDIPTELRDELLARFVELGGEALRAIHLLQLEVTADYRPWCFILEFEESAGAEKRDEIYDKFFRILDNREENFALYVYNKDMDAALKKVEGSCLWRR